MKILLTQDIVSCNPTKLVKLHLVTREHRIVLDRRQTTSRLTTYNTSSE